MPRIHLFEFEDLPWFPRFLRNYMTDFLQFLSNRTKLYRGIVPLLRDSLQESGTSKIIDLGSGGGGGLLWLNQALKNDVPNLQITLTDYYPNQAAFELTCKKEKNIDFVSKSVDARAVPEDLSGFRTQFLSLHHFKPDDAKRILQNAIDSKRPIGIFEAQERTFASMLAMLLSPLSVLLSTPFIRPFRIGRIIFTYLIPLVPLFVCWDGVISSLRTYSVKEMQVLINSLENNESMNWKVGREKSGPGYILYLIGIPKN